MKVWVGISHEPPKPRYILNRRHCMFFQVTNKYRNRFFGDILRYFFLLKMLQSIAGITGIETGKV